MKHRAITLILMAMLVVTSYGAFALGYLDAIATGSAQDADDIAALQEVLRITDRKHDAWDRAKLATAKISQ